MGNGVDLPTDMLGIGKIMDDAFYYGGYKNDYRQIGYEINDYRHVMLLSMVYPEQSKRCFQPAVDASIIPPDIWLETAPNANLIRFRLQKRSEG
jgi:hypothetical protein